MNELMLPVMIVATVVMADASTLRAVQA